MCKLTHLIRYTVQSKCVIFAVLERRLIHGVITGCSFFYLIFYDMLKCADFTPVFRNLEVQQRRGAFDRNKCIS